MSAQALDFGPLPRVQGRHNNRPLARLRSIRAVQLVSSGRTYRQVAAEMGYANPGTVHRIVQKATARATVEAVEERRDVEGSRLDALQASLWDRAMTGDVQAGRLCMAIIVHRIRLFGLDQDQVSSRCNQPQTVVLAEDDCRLRGCPEHA